jgi:hypothetical protein
MGCNGTEPGVQDLVKSWRPVALSDSRRRGEPGGHRRRTMPAQWLARKAAEGTAGHSGTRRRAGVGDAKLESGWCGRRWRRDMGMAFGARTLPCNGIKPGLGRTLLFFGCLTAECVAEWRGRGLAMGCDGFKPGLGSRLCGSLQGVAR